MQKAPISFKDFDSTISAIRDMEDLNGQLSKISHGNINAGFVSDHLEDVVLNMVSHVMHDDVGFSDISYFCWELDFGRSYEPWCIVDEHGMEVNLSDTLHLYQYLCEQNGFEPDMDGVFEEAAGD